MLIKTISLLSFGEEEFLKRLVKTSHSALFEIQISIFPLKALMVQDGAQCSVCLEIAHMILVKASPGTLA